MPITTTPSGGPQGEFSTYTPIYSTTFSSAASSIIFSNIPTTFTDLVVVIGGKFSADISAGIYFNEDSNSNYATTRMWGNGTSAQSSSSNNSTQIALTAGNGSVLSTYIVNIMNYSNPSTYKPVLGRASQDQVSSRIGMWKSSSPITSITFVGNGGNFAVGTVITVYGIKAAATQFIPTKAAGGNIFASDGTYAYHAFTSTGIFVPQVSLTADVLVVAGGGAGGGSGGGGGGAGGIIAFASQSLSAGSYNTCTVGAGGAGGFNQTLVGGTASQFASLTAAGAGGGGVGASGNVAGGTSGTPTSFAGGSGTATGFPCGGGGGAGGAGGNATTSSGGTGGAGGSGLSTVTNWGSLSAALTALGLGVSGQIGGGGGGAGGKNGTTGPGGAATAGGGNGGQGNNAGAGGTGGVGLPATGGGGGGGGIASTTDGPGGAGGSGVIIVRYAL